MKRRHRKALYARLDKIIALLSHTPTDVVLDVHPHKEPVMTKQKISLKVKVSKGARQSPVPPVTIHGPTDISLTFLDDQGAAIPGISAANVTSTLDSDNPAVAFTASDSLNYKASIPAGTTGVANLTLTASVKSPAAGPFTSTCVATLDIPPTPPVPVDIILVITPSP